MVSHKISIIFSCFTFFSLCSSAANAEEPKDINIAEFYECNDLYCPNSISSSADDALQKAVGFVLPSMPTTRVQVLQKTLSLKKGTIPTKPRNTQTSTETIGKSASTPDDPSEASDSTDGEGKAATDPGAQPGGFDFQSPGVPNVQQASMNLGTSSVNPNLKSGLLYSDDDGEDKQSEISQPQQGSGSAFAGLSQASSSAVGLNKANDSSPSGKGSPTGGSFPRGSSNGALSGNHGDFESGKGATTTPVRDSYLDQLANIAAKMGESFFGASGSGKTGSRRSTEMAALGKARKVTPAGGANLASNEEMRRLLQSRMGRSFASQLEFAGKDTSMFGRMCDHYANYARKNGIPNDQSSCPSH